MAFSAPGDRAAGAPDSDWDEAFVRVESYLRAYGLESRLLLNRVAAELVGEARAVAQAEPDTAPVTLTMRLAHERIADWFARASGERDWSNWPARAEGRLALILADLPGRWSRFFLSLEAMPKELAAALAMTEVLPAPAISLSPMAPEPLEFGLPEMIDPRRLIGTLWLPARTLMTWSLIVGFFGVAWVASH